MARLPMQLLRRISCFSNSSFECLGTCHDFASNRYAFSNSYSINRQKRSSRVVLTTWDVLGHFKAKQFEASKIRTLATESTGKGGEDELEKPRQSTKIDGGKKYSVVQIDSGGSWRTVWRNAVELVSTSPFFVNRCLLVVSFNY